jgi:hypothetical protein
MSLFRSFLLVTSIASSQAHTHTHTRQYRPSLLGVSSHSWDDVLLARTFARKQRELKLSESSGMKNEEEDVAFSVDPIGIYASGLAHVNVSWSSKLMDIQDDIITVSCAEPEDTLFGDYFPVDSATSFKVFVLPRGVGCKFVFRYIRGASSYIGPQPDIPLSADGTPRSTAVLVAEAKPLSLGNDTYHNESFRPDSLSWTAAQDAEWGFSSVEAFNRSHLLFSFHTNIDGGKVRDSSWIIRPERIIN